MKLELAKNLREALNAKGYSFKELSLRSNVPVKTLYHWANGQQPRKMEHLYEVSRVLNLTLEELIFGRKALVRPVLLQIAFLGEFGERFAEGSVVLSSTLEKT